MMLGGGFGFKLALNFELEVFILGAFPFGLDGGGGRAEDIGPSFERSGFEAGLDKLLDSSFDSFGTSVLSSIAGNGSKGARVAW